MKTFSGDTMHRLPISHGLHIYMLLCSLCTVTCFDKFGAPLVASSDKVPQPNKTDSAGDLPNIMKRYHPQPKHLKVKKLLRRLGDHFDPDWMSINRPEPNTGDIEMDVETNDTFAETHKQVLKYMGSKVDNNIFYSLNVEPLARFLHDLSTCKVRYEWSDLGELFWPRFIKSGLCTSTASCSWPRGMTCMPGRLKAVHLLRWRCKRRRSDNRKRRNDGKSKRNNGRKESKLACSWKIIPYHVPVDCACSC